MESTHQIQWVSPYRCDVVYWCQSETKQKQEGTIMNNTDLTPEQTDIIDDLVFNQHLTFDQAFNQCMIQTEPRVYPIVR